MNILELMRFIQNLDTKYFKEINISRSVLYELKKTPKKLYKSKFITVQKLYDYMIEYKNLEEINKEEKIDNDNFFSVISNQQEQIINDIEDDYKYYDKFGKNIIGIDIGQKNIFSASDHKREKIFTVTENIRELNKFTKDYIKILNQSKKLNFNSLKKSHRDNYIKKIEGIINKSVNDCIKYFTNKSTFVIGKINFNTLSKYDPFYIIGELVLKQFKNKLDGQNKIFIINESHTSIKCPKCNNINKKNRTQGNKFKCKTCNFKFNHDDILAASNIAKIFINRNIQ